MSKTAEYEESKASDRAVTRRLIFSITGMTRNEMAGTDSWISCTRD